MQRINANIIFVLAIWSALQACSHHKTIEIAARPDSLLIIYREGCGLLDAGELVQAEVRFRSLLQKRAAYAPALEGLAHATLLRGNLAEAEKWVRLSLQADSSWKPARVIRGKIFLQQHACSQAMEEFLQALQGAARYSSEKMICDAYFGLGTACMECGDYGTAADAMRSALKIDPVNRPAQAMLSEIHRRSELVAGLPPNLKNLALQSTVTRGDLARCMAQILAGNHNSLQAVTGRPALDVEETHPDAMSIACAIREGLMTLLPDSAFRPGLKVVRAGFAVICQDYLVRISGYPDLPVKYFKIKLSPFVDVQVYQPYFSAAMLVKDLRILQIADDGLFRPLENVSGIEAVIAVKRLQQLVAELQWPPGTDK
jgi:tetratricopeptide (TPR) repeat protein